MAGRGIPTSESHDLQVEAFLRKAAEHEQEAEGERGKKRVFALIFAYGEYQKAGVAALNAVRYDVADFAKDSSLRVLRAIEPLLAKRKRKKPRGRSIIE